MNDCTHEGTLSCAWFLSPPVCLRDRKYEPCGCEHATHALAVSLTCSACGAAFELDANYQYLHHTVMPLRRIGRVQ